jgi:asparagine synthase (glutamine-hydrolysing)
MRFRQDRAAPPGRLVFLDIIPDFRLAAQQAQRLYGQAMIEARALADPCGPFTFSRPWPPVDIALTGLICSTYLRENGITQGDRLAMASSIELRLPLVDYRLVETVVGLRRAHSDRSRAAKAWLKDALNGLLPADVVRRPKQGFAPPALEWHRALFDAYGGSLRDGHLAEKEILTREASLELSGGALPPGVVVPLSFKALVLEHWCRRLSSVLPVAGQSLAAH